MFDTANFSYILPTHRATIYFLGVYLAHLLKYSNSQVYFSNVSIILIVKSMFAIN